MATKTDNKKKTIISRGWMVTINNPKIPGDAYLAQWFADGNIVFGCGQLEQAPETGTPHLQMYIVTKVNDANKNGFGVKWMKENIHSTAHLDKRQGSHEEARDYCTLKEYKGKTKIVLAGPWTIGEWSEIEEKKKGSTKGGAKVKLNWETMLGEVKAGRSDKYLMEKYPHLFLTSHKAIEKARLVYASEVTRQQPKVFVLYGVTGSGKSHKANQIMLNNGGGHVFHKGNHGNFWADGYDPMRHNVVWFDEFDGSWFSYKQLLRVCDKWPYNMETKGGTVNFNPKLIIFTSSKHPKEWYSVEAVPDTSELMRRLSGKHGCIINMTTKFNVPVEDGPNLVEEFDKYLSGEIFKEDTPAEPANNIVAVTKYINTNPIPVGVDDVPPRRVIDLTCDDEVLGGPTPPRSDDGDDTRTCGMCGNFIDTCECFDAYASGDREGSGTDSIEDDGYTDEDLIALREAQRISVDEARKMRFVNQQDFDRDFPKVVAGTPVQTSATSVPNAPRKRAAELTFEPPPKAPASEFKKYKQVPGQARLAVRPWQEGPDADDDVDDK